jgi:tRNA threonylcarbamoyladenosine biosynthesis protein TsaE
MTKPAPGQATSLVRVTHAPAETVALGAAVGRLLHAGDILALCGPLGAGKTQFVKGLAVGLDVPAEEPVVSPTFVLVREYLGRLRLYHFDAYRLGSAAELADLGLTEMATEPDAVVAVEWADRFPGVLPPHTVRIRFEHVDPNTRSLQLDLPAELPRARAAEWLAAWPARAADPLAEPR